MLMGHALGDKKSSLRESSNLRESLTLRESSNLRIRSNNTRIYRAGILSAFALFLLTINLLFPISVDTNSAEGAALPSTTELAINTDYSSANLDFTTISSTGTFASSSAEDIAKFTVTTNNYTGYTLTLAGNDDTGQLNNISAGAALDSIATSGIESSSFSTNEWGYLPSKYNSEANTTKYYSAPTTSDTDTLDVTNAANASNTPNEYTISLGAKVDYSKPAGTYTNTFILAAVGNPVNYTINYLDGTNDPTVQDLPTAQSSTTGSSSVVLNPNKTPTRTGYTFSKWCMGTVNTTAPSATDHTTGTVCTGTEYANGDSASFVDQTVSSSTLNLYALWTPNKYNITIKTAEGIDEVSLNNSTCTSSTDGCVVNNLSYNNDYTLTATPASGYNFDGWSTPTYGTIAALTSTSTTYTVGPGSDTIIPSASIVPPEYMQNWSKADTLNIGDETTLIDARDGKYYKVAKLADGKVWMTTSLNLAGGTKLYSETSDVPAGYPESGGTGYFTLPSSSTSGFSSDTTAYVYNAPNKNNPDPSNPTTCTPADGSPCDSYYSWLAATAGGKDASGSAVTGNGPDTAYSVCPKGWRLPKSGNYNDTSATSATGYKKGDFYKLATAYGANLESQYYESAATFYNNAGPGTLPNFLLAGLYNSSSFSSGGSYGHYWSSSSSSSAGAYGLSFSSSYVDSAHDYARRLGFSVRCVLREPIENISSMQEFGALDASTKAALIDSMDTTKSYALKDARDNKYYNIAKLADGKVWMTTSLNLAGGTKLDSDGSDVPSGYTQSSPYYTLPTSSTSGFLDDTTAYVYNAPNKNNPDPSNPTTCTSANGSPCDSYYSWLTATAGGKDASGSAVTGDGYNAAYSVCPKGWRLPTATTSNASAMTSPNWKTGDIYKLATAYGANLESNWYESSATFYNNAGPGTLPNFLLAGYYLSSSFYDGGSYGYYWSSSSRSSTNAYTLFFSSSRVDSASDSLRRFGYPVRCILKEGASNINEIETMQELGKTDFKTEVLASMDSSTAYTLKDERDNEYYKVAKLADGKVWMTTSLNLAGGTKLYSETSDVPAGYPESGGTGYFTLPSSSTSGFNSDTTAFLYNAPNKNNPDPSNPTTCTPADGSPCDSYYSWPAATAGGKDANGSAVTGNGPDTAYSVCPKGWRLPKSGNYNDTSVTSTTGYKKGDFYKLATAYGANLESNYYENSVRFYNNAGSGTLPNFLLAGYYSRGSFYAGGSYSNYWSSSSYSTTNAYGLYFNSSSVYSALDNSRRYGFPVRCILRES